MDSGVSEAEAYRHFGERCAQIKYKTFATLLIQNLQKGSRRMSDMLEQESMYGGLLFIGIFFSAIFLICLLVILYYKQVTEGFEDQSSFEIMQKVGMSDKEVKGTIQKQILLVFFLPLAGAFCHTAAGTNMVIKLLGALNLFAPRLIVLSALCVSGIFALLYILCYRWTARTYYKIVRWR